MNDELQDFRRQIRTLAIEILKIREELATKTEVATQRQRLDKVTTLLEKLSGSQQDHTRTILVFDDILGKHRLQLENHENRISALE